MNQLEAIGRNIMASSFDIIFIGHFAVDTIIYNNKTSHSVGGGVTYGSLAAYNYNPNLQIGICSEVGKDFKQEYLKEFKSTSIDLEGVHKESACSTNYRLYYHDGTRDLTLEACADEIQFERIPKKYRSAKAFMLCPIANEIPLEFISDIIEKTKDTGAIIGLDVQGFIRKFNQDGSINKTRDIKYADKMKKIIEICDGRLVLKASDDEANYITGLSDVIASTKELSKLTNAIILSTLGANGSLAKYKDNKMVHIPAFVPKKIVDETGAGDCYSAVFLSEYINSDRSWDAIQRSANHASVAASFLLEEKGPHGFGSSKQIEERFKQNKTLKSSFQEKITNIS
jgi:sugar/nucleoside kinase (ribokinase family)